MTTSELTFFAFAQAARQSEPRKALPPVPDLLCKRYRIERLLGVGGMGAVFRARDLLREQLGDPSPVVAIKTLNNQCAEYPDAPTLLHSEFVRTLSLRHPNIVRALHFDIDSESEHPFIVLELLTGTALDQLLLRQPGGISWRDLSVIGQGILAAVDYCHEIGTVHGDIKPSNIFVGNDGVRLFDFGLGRSVLGDLPTIDAERFNAWTPRYAAPEVLQGEPVSKASDIYSLGRVMLQLSGALNPGAECAPHRPSSMPMPIWKILNQAIALRPSERCSARQLLHAWRRSEGRTLISRMTAVFG